MMLDGSRTWGMGFPQAITLAEINAYAVAFEFQGEDQQDLCHYIRALDALYLKIQADNREREAKKKRA